MQKGFTLIELLIVIGILAILAVAVVLVLNPAELLAQARDSQRISDLSSVKSAIALYLSTASSPAVAAGPTCTINDTAADGCPGATAEDGPFGTGAGAADETSDATTEVDGNGWVKVDLTGATGGSPLSALPTDPTNTGKYYYAYKGDATNKTFELDARLESTKYRGQMTSDGGSHNTCPSTYTEDECFYEVGTDSGLDL